MKKLLISILCCLSLSAFASDYAKFDNMTVKSALVGSIEELGFTVTQRDSSRAWRAVASSADGKYLVAAALTGYLYTSVDYGVTWVSRDSVRGWYAVASSADGSKLVAAESGGQIYTSTDYGTNWVARDSNRAWYWLASSADGKNLAATVFNGKIYTSVDAGTNWAVSSSITADWYRIASSSDGTKLVACVSGGYLYTSTDAGTNWTQRESTRYWFGVASSADGTKLFATGDGGVYRSVDAGTNWVSAASSVGAIACSADGTRLLGYQISDNMYSSEDSGVTWVNRGNSGLQGNSIACSSDGKRAIMGEYAAGYLWSVVWSISLPTVSGFSQAGHFAPSASNVFDLGSIDYPWRDLYLSTNSIYMGGTKVMKYNSTLGQLETLVPVYGATGVTNDFDQFLFNNAVGNILTVSNGAFTFLSSPNMSGGGSGISNVDAVTVGGYTPSELTAVAATYYMWGSLAGPFTNPASKMLKMDSPSGEAVWTSTATGTNNMMLGYASIDTNQLPRVLSNGKATVNVSIERDGNATPRTMQAFMDVYESNMTTLVVHYVGDVMSVPNTKQHVPFTVPITNSVVITDFGRLVVFYFKLIDGWSSDTISVYSQNGELTYVTLSTVASGVYVTQSSYNTDRANETLNAVTARGAASTNPITVGKLLFPYVGANDSWGWESSSHSVGTGLLSSVWFGQRALYRSSGNTGAQNVAIGSSALNIFTGGAIDDAVAVGHQAMYDYPGAGNTAVGKSSLYSGAGQYNTAVGRHAGMNVSGVSNLFLGAEAGYIVGPQNLTNTTCVGAGSTPNGNNSVTLGRPEDSVYAPGMMYAEAGLTVSGSGLTAGVIKSPINTTTGVVVTTSDGATNVLVVDTANKRLGINRNPTYSLDVDGKGRFSDDVMGVTMSLSGGNGLYATRLAASGIGADQDLTIRPGGNAATAVRIQRLSGATWMDTLAVSNSGTIYLGTNYTLVADTINNRVGIGTNDPQAKLHVEGSAIITTNLTVANSVVVSNNLSVENDIYLRASNFIGVPIVDANQVAGAASLLLRGPAAGDIRMQRYSSGWLDAVTMPTVSGYLGIATNVPQVTLHVNGSVLIETNMTIRGTGTNSINGVVVLATNAIAWDDMLSGPLQIRTSGPVEASWNDTLGGVQFTTGATTSSANDHVTVTYQSPHRRKSGTDLHPHVHFWQTNADQTNMWYITYAWAGIGQTNVVDVFMGPAVNQIAYTPGTTMHQLAELPAIPADAGKTVSTILRIKLWRNGGSGTGSVTATDVDCHYQIDSFGSDGELTKSF